jgi:two-component system sensor histidine kinase PilS (NtrC family)
MGMLLVVAIGAQLEVEYHLGGFLWYLLTCIYVAAFVSSIWYLIALRRERSISALLTWTQMLVDVSVVAATISFTGEQESFFTFLLVIVILEAGVLMGLIQGFVFATMASLFMAVLFFRSMAEADLILAHWYNFLIQAIAFFFTAFISGYWNQRISRMRRFQREILDNMSGGFLITDAKGIVIAINKAACSILGLEERNIAGRHVDGVLLPESGAECPVMTALRSEKDFTSYEFYAITGATESSLLGLTTNRIRDAHNRVTNLIASFTDLTEMARMRREMQQQDRMAVIGELSAGLAHEIRNPVAAIRGATDELIHNLDAPGLVERLATIAIRESDHLSEIVSGFLDFARDPSRRHEAFDLRNTASEVKDKLVRKYAKEIDNWLTISVFAPKEPCPVMGDPTKMSQVFLNLAQNAVEAMLGHIGNEGVRKHGALDITIKADGNPIEIRFDDEGPGIDPDKVARIFEPFYTEKEKGVGMGLAICMRIVISHNGTIQAAARSGGGTSISVRLPKAALDNNADVISVSGS